ncbi:hypothetical protein SE18_10890 [Herpetosiphon geysericola]|uniref:Tyr recombinase domain-containing protein n=1 Tax=Herpetosiphon geysericola TaxID=70996 RepID=A0A0P6YDH2_9CHLR|nr:hypothetical protein SE18_10890 [Herpetosiphon geysericola]
MGPFLHRSFAEKIFGTELLHQSTRSVIDVLVGWGYSEKRLSSSVQEAMAELLLRNRSPYIADLKYETLTSALNIARSKVSRQGILLISRVLHGLKITSREVAIRAKQDERFQEESLLSGIDSIWVEWCRRWRNTSTLANNTRLANYTRLLRMGRWLTQYHPTITAPDQWTRELAAEFVAAVDRWSVGDLVRTERLNQQKVGKPLSPGAKTALLGAARVFFRDCQEWGWIPRRLDPSRSFGTPRSIRSLIGPAPRVIADDVWAKLLWAGLNLQADDLPGAMWKRGPHDYTDRSLWYPIEMVRALVIVWLFAGLRRDEIIRLRIGCIRWSQGDTSISSEESATAKDVTCWLDVPVNKTTTAFTKPIDRLVGEAIEAWQRVRPEQPSNVDQKTGEVVDYLFSYRGQRVGKGFLNDTLIPILCRKAGVPEHDARGNITSHRARSTIASQLANSKEPMSLFELQTWLGHASPESTLSYVRVTPTKLGQSYTSASYFERNIRTIEVLIDQDAVRSGAAAAGEPWRFYDLGHGYCTYDFFNQCPHRMACAKCSFYVSKASSQSQLLEAKANLLRMSQEIHLTEDERLAVEDGAAAIEQLLSKLVNVSAPDGFIPREYSASKQDIMLLEAYNKNLLNNR